MTWAVRTIPAQKSSPRVPTKFAGHATEFRQNATKLSESFSQIGATRPPTSQALKKSLDVSRVASAQNVHEEICVTRKSNGCKKKEKIVIRNFFVILKPAFVSPKRLEIVFFSHYRLPACCIFFYETRDCLRQ